VNDGDGVLRCAITFIRAESLSMLYKIGALKQRHDPLRDQPDRY